MAANCSIIPQILKDGKSVDSIAFSQLWERAKVLYSDPIEARNKAKEDYYNMFQPAFKNANGDWDLLYRYNNNIMTDHDRLLFTNKYNENLETLKSNIRVPLDINGEPSKYEMYSGELVEPNYWINENSDYIPDGDQIFFNRVAAHIIINKFDTLRELRNKDISKDDSIRTSVVNELKEIQKLNGNNNLKKLIEDIQEHDSYTWDTFVGYFKNKYNYKIQDDTLFDDDATLDTRAEIPKNWDDQAQLKIDYVKTVAVEIKEKIAKSVALNTSIKGVKGTESYVSKFDMNIPLDIDDIWNKIQSINYTSINKDDVIKRLKYESVVFQNGALDEFIKELEPEDSQLYNLFQRTCLLAITSNVSLVIERDLDASETTANYSYRENNRKSKADRIADNFLRNAFENTFKSSPDKIQFKESLIEATKQINNAVKPNIRKESRLYTAVNALENISSLLGAPISKQSIMFYINYKTNSNYGYTDIDNTLESISKDDIKFQQIYSLLSELNSKFSTISNSIAYTGLKTGKRSKVKVTSNSKFVLNKESKGALSDISFIVAMDYAHLSSMSYYSSTGEKEQSPQYRSFITDFFRDININSIDNRSDSEIFNIISNRFSDYFKDPRLDNDNFLWSKLDKNGNYIQRGLFYYSVNENGRKIPTAIDRETLKSFYLISGDGNIYINSNSGDKYRDIKDDAWNLTHVIDLLNGYFNIPISDSGRNHKVTKPFEQFEAGLPFDVFDDKGLLNIDNLKDSLLDFETSRIYRYAFNNLMQDITDIDITFNKVFNIDSYRNGILELKPEFKNNESALIEGLEVVSITDSDGYVKQSAIKNGKPTGSAFKFSLLEYVKNGKKHNFGTFLESKGYDYLQFVVLNKEAVGYNTLLNNLFREFMYDWLVENQKNTIETLKYIKDDILNATSKRNITDDLTEELVDDSETVFAEKKSKYLVKRPSDKDYNTDITFGITSLNVFLNNHFNTVTFGNLLFGSVNEYKQMVDWNKRVNQTTRNGSSTDSKRQYKQLVVEDALLKDNMLGLLDNPNNGTKEELAIIKDRFSGLINTADAFNIITDDEFVARMKDFGVYDRYSEIVDAINATDENGNYLPFNPNDYLYLIEQLKFFSYDRVFDKGRMLSIQNKNSTIVLFKRFVKNTEREDLYNFMKTNKIDDINFRSAHKKGGTVPFMLHDPKTGKLDRKQLSKPSSEILNSSILLNVSKLRIQLDVVPHILNTKNTIPVQVLKKTLDGLINNVDYNIGNRKLKGRTGSYKDSERGVFEEYQYAMSYNVKESMLQLLNTFGAIKDGKVDIDTSTGMINVNVPKIIKTLEEYFIEQSTDMNLIKAVRLNANNESNVPLHYPTILKLIESVLEAKITNNITRQKLPGIHVPIQPGIFLNPTIDKSTDDTYVTYTKEFKEQGDTRLKSEYIDSKGVFHAAQIIINPWDKRFYKPEYLMDDGSGRVDIDKIKAKDPKLLMMYGTRIPHEGPQSALVAEVVGFLQTGASQAVTPDHLVMRSGWDFDIDTVYLFTYEFTDKLKVYDAYSDTDVDSKRRLDRWAKLYYPEQYKEQVLKSIDAIRTMQKEIDDINAKYNPLIDEVIDTHINNKIRDCKNIIEKFQNEIATDKNISDERLAYVKEGILKNMSLIANAELYKYDERDINEDKLKQKADLRKEKYSKLEKDVHELVRERRGMIKIRQNIIDIHKANVNYFTKFKESKLDEFNKLDAIQKATREERNNIIIDSLIGMLSSRYATMSREKPNEMDHVSAASNFVNGLLGIDNSLASITNISDQLRFRNLNMNIATLKEISVAYDNTLSIMGNLGGRVKYNAVEAVIEFNQIKGYDGTNFGSIEKVLDESFGKGNYTYDLRNKKVTVKNIGFIGNNYKRTYTDIQGQKISEQRSELTANVLDAVSKLMVNLTADTFSVFAFLASTPLSYYTDITGNLEVNRYLYPSLIVSQPAIQELSRNIVMNNKFGDTRNSKYSYNIVREKYLRSLIDTNLESLTSYAFIKSKSVKFSDLPKNFIQKYKEMSDADASMEAMNKSASEQLEDLQSRFNDLHKQLIKYATDNKFRSFDTDLIDHFITRELGKSSISGTPNTLSELTENIKTGRSLNIDEYNSSLEIIDNYYDLLDSYIEKGIDETSLNESFNKAEKYIKEYEKNITDHNISQLNILAYYNKVELASKDVMQTMGIFNTDKLGAGPTSNVTNNLFNRLVKFDSNFGRFESFLRSIGDDNVIPILENEINSKVSLKEKLDVVYKSMSEYGFKSNAPMVNDKDISLTTAVYGEVFNNNVDPDPLKSDFPYLQAQLMYSNILSTDVYSSVLLSENHAVKELLNNIAYKLKGVTDDNQRYKTLTYLINQKIDTLPFFRDINTSKIISSVNVGWVKQETERGIVNDFEITEQEQVDINDLNAREDSDKFNYFKSLTLVNQIRLSKHVGTNNKFLERINILSDEKLIKQLGFIKLSVYDSDSEVNAVRVLFKEMYNSNNPYDREIAKNLIRYTFLVNGLQFGSNIAKFMPIEIIFDANETHPDDRDLQLDQLSEIIRHPVLPVDTTNEFMEFLHQANGDNALINPIMEPTYFFNEKTKRKEIRRDLPSFKNYMSDDTSINVTNKLIAEHIIVEKEEFINNSKYADKDYLIKPVKVLDNIYNILYKRAENSRDGFIFYYPIVKTLPFEYGKTDVSLYKMIPNLDTNNQIYTPDEYESEIYGTTLTIEREEEVTTNEGVDSYTSNVRTAVSKSDVIIFIGNEHSFRANVAKQEAKSSNKPFTTISIDRFIKMSGSSLNLSNYKVDGKRLMLIGDENIDLSKESESKVRANINKLVKANTIEQINIVGTKGFEAIVAKTNLKVPLNIENINPEMFGGTLDEVYSENVDSESYASLINKIKFIEENILATTVRFKDTLKDVKVTNRKDIEKVTNKSKKLIENLDPTETSYSAMMDIIDANREIYDFIKARIDDLADDVLYIEIGKFNSNSESDKKKLLEIGDKLINLNDHIFTAIHALSLPEITPEQINSASTIGGELDIDVTEMLLDYNDNIRELRYHLPELEKLNNQTVDQIQILQAVRITTMSRNPKFQSLFTQTVNQLIKDGKADPKLVITPAMLDDVIHKMLNNNADITFFQQKLDSRRDTGVTLVDVMGKLYAEIFYKTRAKASKRDKQFNDMLAKVYKNTGSDIDKDRAAWFLSKFVTEEGLLIDEWDMDSLSNKLEAINIQIENQLNLRENAAAIHDLEQVKRINSEIDNLKGQRDSLSKEEEITDKSSDQYKHLKNVFNSISERQRRRYENDNHVRFQFDGRHLRIFRIIPNEEFVNKKYTSLTEDEKEFLRGVKSIFGSTINDVFTTKIVDNNFIPFDFKSSFKREGLQFIGVVHKSKENTEIDLHNELKYVKESNMLKEPRSTKKIIYGSQFEGESYAVYQNRILTEVNKNRDDNEKFKSIRDIKEYNKELDKQYAIQIKSDRNFDIGNLAHRFFDDMAQVEIAKLFESEYRLALLTLSSEEFKASKSTFSGKTYFDKTLSRIAGRREVVKSAGKETDIYKHFATFDKALKDVSRIQTSLDVKASMLLRATSISTMAFNYKGGINNVMQEYSTRLIESMAGEHFNVKELHASIGQYIASKTHLFAALGKSETQDLTVGMLKFHNGIYEEHTDGHAAGDVSTFGYVSRKWDNAAYLPMNVTEHFMQYATMLSMMKSNRLIHGQFMTLNDYIGDRRLEAIKDLLTKDQYNEIFTKLTKARQNSTDNTDYWDIFNNWMINHSTDFTKDQIKAIKNAILESEKNAKVEFEKYETLESQYELYDGVVRIKEGSDYNETLVAQFEDKVKRVNHTLSGIYNKIDRNQIQDQITGEIIMQFSKWIRPTFIRYFGTKFGKTYFSEATGTYRAGAYMDFWNFLKTPIKSKAKYTSQDSNIEIDAARNIFQGYIQFLGNISFYYHLLPSHQKANVIRSISSIIGISGSALALFAVAKLLGADDEDKKQSHLALLTIYELSRIQTDLTQTLPVFGWFSFYKQRKTNIVPAERTITDLAKLIYYGALYPLQDQDNREYQRGLYNGETKVSVVVKRLIPGVRQIQSHQHLGSSISYYQMYNPLSNLLSEFNNR